MFRFKKTAFFSWIAIAIIFIISLMAAIYDEGYKGAVEDYETIACQNNGYGFVELERDNSVWFAKIIDYKKTCVKIEKTEFP